MNRSDIEPMTEPSEGRVRCNDGIERNVIVESYVYRRRLGFACWTLPAMGVGALMFLTPENSSVEDEMVTIKSFVPDITYFGVHDPSDVIAEMLVQVELDHPVRRVFDEADELIDKEQK